MTVHLNLYVFVDLRCAECAHCLNCSSFDDSLACACETGYTGARCQLGKLKDDVMFAFIKVALHDQFCRLAWKKQLMSMSVELDIDATISDGHLMGSP